MGIEYLRGMFKQAVDRFNKPKTYEGMEEDIQLVSFAIIPQDLGQNIETVSSEGISEGTPENALKRLLRVSDMEKIAKEINRRFGHGYPGYQRDVDSQVLQERLGELESSSRYEG